MALLDRLTERGSKMPTQALVEPVRYKGALLPSLEKSAGKKPRLTSIDMLRGLVLVIMALDHVRDMLTHPHSGTYSAAVDFAGADAGWFFTRWVTHLCAPTFVLLAGVSAYLYGAMRQRSTREVAGFLASRGMWLVIVELTLVNFAWMFNVRTPPLLQVIWAIGVSMLALSALVWLPRKAIWVVGVGMILGHNLLDRIQPPLAQAPPAWMLLHMSGPLVIGDTTIALVVYPLIPWIGVMAVGYGLGTIYAEPDPRRPRRLVAWGALLLVAFLLLRLTNVYGDPVAWGIQQGATGTLISFLGVTKYPPSLQFLLLTLGAALMLLGAFEVCEARVADKLITIGRVSFFYYVVHLYLIHGVAVALGVWQGFTLRQMAVFFLEYPAGFGVGLGGVYVVWIGVVLALYPACAWYAGVKARRHDWWLKYL